MLRVADGMEIYSVRNATNPALAVDASGRLGFLFQPYTNGRWRHQLVVLKPTGAPVKKITMADTPAGEVEPTSVPFQGDYLDLIAMGNQFLGVLSAMNDPKRALFPFGVRYNRICIGGFPRRGLGGLPVRPSVDPFFFRVDVDAPPNFVTGAAQRPC